MPGSPRNAKITTRHGKPQDQRQLQPDLRPVAREQPQPPLEDHRELRQHSRRGDARFVLVGLVSSVVVVGRFGDAVSDVVRVRPARRLSSLRNGGIRSLAACLDRRGSVSRRRAATSATAGFCLVGDGRVHRAVGGQRAGAVRFQPVVIRPVLAARKPPLLRLARGEPGVDRVGRFHLEIMREVLRRGVERQTAARRARSRGRRVPCPRGCA